MWIKFLGCENELKNEQLYSNLLNNRPSEEIPIAVDINRTTIPVNHE